MDNIKAIINKIGYSAMDIESVLNRAVGIISANMIHTNISINQSVHYNSQKSK